MDCISMGSQRVRHDWATFPFIQHRRKLVSHPHYNFPIAFHLRINYTIFPCLTGPDMILPLLIFHIMCEPSFYSIFFQVLDLMQCCRHVDLNSHLCDFNRFPLELSSPDHCMSTALTSFRGLSPPRSQLILDTFLASFFFFLRSRLYLGQETEIIVGISSRKKFILKIRSLQS